MDDSGPPKHELISVFKKLRSLAPNKVCFDCGAKNPTWASVTYGVFICIDCSAIHRGLGVHVSFVRSTTLDTNWTWLQMRAMQLGGNSSAMQFFRQHGSTSIDTQQKYKSRAAQLYREKLHHSAVAAIRLHGTKLHLDSELLSPGPTEPEPDFFSEHSEMPHNLSELSLGDDAYMTETPKSRHQSTDESNIKGPCVEGLNEEVVQKAPVRMTIGQRKPQGKKSGIGAKKGLGAQKVTANFSEIEQQAEILDKQRLEATKQAISTTPKELEPDFTKLSARLMVQDIDKERKKEEERLRSTDPKKGDQMERLGMGFKSRGGVSHSIGADVQTIQQEGVRGKSQIKSRDPVEDDWEILNKQPNNRRNNNGLEDLEARNLDEDEFFSTFDKDHTEERGSTTSSRVKTSFTSGAASEGDALKKFGNAKAISSEQYFGDKGTDFETRSNLAKFQDRSAIGSADLFGQETKPSSGYGSYAAHVPDLTDVKDSMRQGVARVAGRLSSLGSSVHNYVSDHYGY